MVSKSFKMVVAVTTASTVFAAVCLCLLPNTDVILSLITSQLFWWTLAFLGAFQLRSFLRAQKFRSDMRVARRKFQFPKSTTELRVLSLNIFLRPPIVKNNEDDYKNERLEAFFDHLDSYDVIILQECFQLLNSRPRRLIERAKEAGFAFHAMSYRPALLSRHFIDAGLLVLSRYPIARTDARIYSTGNQIDAWAAKQCVHALIEVGENRKLHVFTTHMQASYNYATPANNARNSRVRMRQVTEMAQFIHSVCCNSPHPVLITGDLNVDALQNGGANDEYRHLMREMNALARTRHHGPVADLLKQDNGGKHPVTYGDVDPDDPTLPRDTVLTHVTDHCAQMCLDYMMFMDSHVNSAAEASIKPVSGATHVEPLFVSGKPFGQISDHYAVTTRLTINTPPSSAP